MTIEVEKGVPLPDSKWRGAAKYPWLTLEVGDSFFVPGIKSASRISGQWWVQKRTGRKFTKRAVDGGVRVWRIK